jgi:transcriptional regulator with XRE-family HTH domain
MKKKSVVGENLRKIRLRLGLTQEEVALRSGLSQSYINQLESGKRKFTQKSLENIAKGMNIPLIDFFKKESEDMKVCEEVSYYGSKAKDKRINKEIKEMIRILSDLPPRLKKHYFELLRLEKALWKKRQRY